MRGYLNIPAGVDKKYYYIFELDRIDGVPYWVSTGLVICEPYLSQYIKIQRDSFSNRYLFCDEDLK